VEARESILDASLREFEEESAASVAAESLTKRAILTFVFRGNPKVMQVKHKNVRTYGSLNGRSLVHA